MIEVLGKAVAKAEWLPYMFRYRIVKALLKVFKLEEPRFTTKFFGLLYEGNSTDHIDWQVRFFGAYEIGILRLISRLLGTRRQSVFVDVGANVGQHSLFASTVAKKVHAFEPYEAVRKRFRRNIEINNITNIDLHPYGLGVANEMLNYYEPQGQNTGMGTFVEGVAASGKTLLLSVKAGDEALENCGVDRVDLIKIDVEGFERNVVIGLRNTLINQRPCIIMEFSGATAKDFESLDKMKSHFPADYSFFRVVDPFSSTVTLSKFDFSVFGHSNVLAVPNQSLKLIKVSTEFKVIQS